MLPPISSIAPARTAQPARDLLAGQIVAANVADGELDAASPADTRTPIQERLTKLELSGQLAGGRGVLNVTDMIGSILNIERQANETLADYADRLLEALKTLSPAAQNGVQKALAQWVRSMALELLIQALRNPGGPEAAKLAIRLESLGLDNELVQQQINAAYAENEGLDALPNAPQTAMQPRSTSTTNSADQPRANNLPGQPAMQSPTGLRPEARAGLPNLTPGIDETLQTAPPKADRAEKVDTIIRQVIQGRSDGGGASITGPLAVGLAGALEPQSAASDAAEPPAPEARSAFGNAQPVSAERAPASGVPNGQPPVQRPILTADAAITHERTIGDQSSLQGLLEPAMPGDENEVLVRKPSSGPSPSDRVGHSSEAKDAQVAKALLLNSLFVEQLEEGILGVETSTRTAARVPAAASQIPPPADGEVQEFTQSNRDGQPTSVNKASAQDALADQAVAAIIPRDLATLSLTSALLQDESAMAGLAQALVQMRTVLGQGALPPHVLYPADGRGGEDDDEVRVEAVDAEDEDRHQKRQDQGQNGGHQSRDQHKDQGQEDGLTENRPNEGLTSSAPEPADFYHRLGGW